jgi:hypothetical protein
MSALVKIMTKNWIEHCMDLSVSTSPSDVRTLSMNKMQGGDEGGGAASPLGIKSMAGTFVISIALMLIGLVIHLIQFIRRRRHPGLFPVANQTFWALVFLGDCSS